MKKIILILLCSMFCCFATKKYVRASGGNDASDGTSFANGWATIGYVFSSTNGSRAAGGDSIYICGDTVANWTFTISSPCTLQFASLPTITAPVYLIGCDSTGTIKTGFSRTKITTTTDALATLFLHIKTTYNTAYIRYQNLLMDGGGSGKATNAIATSDETNYGFVLTKCRVTRCAGDGIRVRMDNSNGQRYFINSCEIDNNGGWGTNYFTNAYQNVGDYIGNSIHHNTSGGVNSGCAIPFTIAKNLIYRNGGDGFKSGTAVSVGSVINIFENVFFANTGDGLDVAANTQLSSLVNNIFRSNGGYGVNTTTGSIHKFYCTNNNCLSNNTSGAVDINGGVLPGTNNITTAPLFISETDNSENFAYQSSSPCIKTGFPYIMPRGLTTFYNIGLYQDSSAGINVRILTVEDSIRIVQMYQSIMLKHKYSTATGIDTLYKADNSSVLATTQFVRTPTSINKGRTRFISSDTLTRVTDTLINYLHMAMFDSSTTLLSDSTYNVFDTTGTTSLINAKHSINSGSVTRGRSY